MLYRTDPSIEKRESPRINWINSEVQVIIKSLNAQSQMLGWIEDISQGGFKVRADNPQDFSGLLGKWDEFSFETSENFFQLKGEGRIVWISVIKNMAGIKFIQLDEKSGRFLDGFLGILP